MKAGCAGCGLEWNGLSQAHCKQCHAHFGSDSAFDRHLIRNYNRKGWEEHSGVPAVECMTEPEMRSARFPSGKNRLVHTKRGEMPLWVTELREGAPLSNQIDSE